MFVDTCLPFGLRSAPKLSNLMADLLAILQDQEVSFVIHYLDDYLTIGNINSNECHYNLQAIIQICQALGSPSQPKK